MSIFLENLLLIDYNHDLIDYSKLFKRMKL